MVAGYILTSVTLATWFFVGKRSHQVLRLGALSNGLLVFYALCMDMLSLVALVSSLSRHTQSGEEFPWRFVLAVILPLSSIVALFLLARRNPLVLSIPFGILIIVASANRELMTSIFTHEAYIYLLMGALYFLVVFLLYLLSGWIEKAVK